MLIRNTFINKNAPLNNGVGRFIPQLARITLKVNIYLISSALRNRTSVRSVSVLKRYVGTIGLAFSTGNWCNKFIQEILNGLLCVLLTNYSTQFEIFQF